MSNYRWAWIVLLVAAFACTAPDEPGGGDGDPPDYLGPVEVGDVDDDHPIGRFDLESLSQPATSAVAAVAPDGTRYYGYIDGTTQWPVVIDDEGNTYMLFQGTHADGNSALAMVASGDGSIHVATAGGGLVYYGRLRDGAFEPTQIVNPVPARDPTLAVSPSGEIVIAYVAEAPAADPTEPPRIHVVRGTPSPAGVSFGSPTVANPTCCVNELGAVAEQMSGPTLVIGADGSTHIVFEWTTFANSTVEYVHDVGGQFNTPVTISEAAFVPCPALAVDEDNKAYITFLEEPNRDVFLVEVEDDVASERVSLYTTQDYITMSMMVRDASGDMHVLVTDNTAAGGRLLYVAPGADPLDPALEIAMSESPGFVEMTPRAGGLIISPSGDLLVGLERVPRFNEMGSAEIAASL